MRQFQVSFQPKQLYLGEKFQMASITISDLCPTELEYEQLSNREMEAVVGGRRRKVKVDLDGDGKWDVKIVVR
jgi:hypothetical protein